MRESLPLLLTLLAALATFGVCLGVHSLLASEADVGERLGSYIGPTLRERVPSSSSQRDRRRSPAVARGFSASVAQELARADLKLTVTEYVFLHFVTALVCFTVGFAATRQATVGMAFGVLGLFLPRIYVTRRQRQRVSAFNNQLADTMMLVANSLRSGYSLLQSFEVVAREAPQPTSDEFSRVVREVGLGLSPEEALMNLVRRLESEDLEMMVTAINVQHEVGGNLARILDTLSGTIRQRVRVKGEIRTLTSQQRLSGYIISLLPVVVGGVLYMVNPEYIGRLFSFKRVICMPIIALPIIAAVLIVVGFLVIRKLADIEV